MFHNHQHKICILTRHNKTAIYDANTTRDDNATTSETRVDGGRARFSSSLSLRQSVATFTSHGDTRRPTAAAVDCDSGVVGSLVVAQRSQCCNRQRRHRREFFAPSALTNRRVERHLTCRLEAHQSNSGRHDGDGGGEGESTTAAAGGNNGDRRASAATRARLLKMAAVRPNYAISRRASARAAFESSSRRVFQTTAARLTSDNSLGCRCHTTTA